MSGELQPKAIPVWVFFFVASIVGAGTTIGGAFWRMGSLQTTVSSLVTTVGKLEEKLDMLITRDDVLVFVDAEVRRQIAEHAAHDGHAVMEQRMVDVLRRLEELESR